MPKVIDDPHEIDGPVIVKYAGAKGGRVISLPEITEILEET